MKLRDIIMLVFVAGLVSSSFLCPANAQSKVQGQRQKLSKEERHARRVQRQDERGQRQKLSKEERQARRAQRQQNMTSEQRLRRQEHRADRFLDLGVSAQEQTPLQALRQVHKLQLRELRVQQQREVKELRSQQRTEDKQRRVKKKNKE